MQINHCKEFQSWRFEFPMFFSNGFPTSEKVYYASKPMERAVCYFNNINLNFPWVYWCNQR